MTSPTTDRRLGLQGGTAIKAPVDCATTANITLSGEQTIDGVTTSSSRVLVKNQTNGVQNGIYRSSTGAWTREPDADGTYDLVCGTLVGIAGGAQAFGIYQITTTGTITPGTTSITFSVALTAQAISAYMQTLLAAANAAAARSLLGVAPRATRTDVATATTTDITTNAPNTDDIRLTGTATITSFTIATDRVLRVIANGAFTLTNNANIVTNTGANIIAAVGDTFILRATAANTVEVLNYVRISSLSTSSAQQLQTIPSPTLAANAMTIPAPSANFTLDFRNSALGNGSITTVSGAPSSLTIPSGATLGMSNGVEADIALLVINNSGTLEYAVANLGGVSNLSEAGVISTTAISAASTSSTVFYSNSARTNVAYRLVGIYRNTQATAGTWVTSPSLIQGTGGEASVKMAMSAAGGAPVFAARAWCVFNGATAGTNAPTAGGNVTSVTRNGTGDYTINFTNAMPDANYVIVATGIQGAAGNQGTIVGDLASGTRTTSAIQIRASQGTSNIDASVISVAIFR